MMNKGDPTECDIGRQGQYHARNPCSIHRGKVRQQTKQALQANYLALGGMRPMSRWRTVTTP